jgi:ferric-dicitrate binding protein FerR (iron transport regulator)
MPRDSPDRLDELLFRLADGLLAEGDAVELDQILRENSEARERYRVFSATHLMLASGHYESVESPPAPVRQHSFQPWMAAAAAIALLATGIALWQSTGSKRSLPASAGNEQEKPVLAVVAYAENANWNLAESAAGGMKLRTTPVTLTSGILMLDLIGGQTVTLRAPARFELIGEREMNLALGDASLRMHDNRVPYIIRVPSGAVVDLGTEFSVNVASTGTSDVHVFEGLANASVAGANGSTREEQLLRAGQSVRVSNTLENSPTSPSDFLRQLPMEVREASPAGDVYAKTIARSAPVVWWNFEGQVEKSSVPPAAGGQPLMLREKPLLAGPAGRRFLLTDTGSHAGFAITEHPIKGLDTPAGLTVECLIYPLSEQQGTAFVLDEPAPSPSRQFRRNDVKHPPQCMLIERTGLRGSNIGQVHPDFALRTLMRSPSDYEGGINTYSSESHLLHRWIHVVFTHDGKSLRLYIDGKLSNEANTKLPFQNAELRPIIARLHTLSNPERGYENRQWHGGIDEVAIYNRVVDPAEIRSHADALER